MDREEMEEALDQNKLYKNVSEFKKKNLLLDGELQVISNTKK